MDNKIRVLIVDDSALMRKALEEILTSDENIEVVGFAKDGQEACEKVRVLKPNVITIDINMPVMNGLDAIQAIMSDVPTPIIVVSSMDARIVAKALVIGAMDFVVVSDEIDEVSKSLIEKVKISSNVRPLKRIPPKIFELKEKKEKDFKKEFSSEKDLDFVVSIGASTGGPQALQVVLSSLPESFNAGILIVQHMSDGFIGGLADWLSSVTPHKVELARTGDILKNGKIFLAPDRYHLCIDDHGVIQLKKGSLSKSGFVPSIDETMASVGESFGSRSIGVIMTGMGRDGSVGIETLKRCKGKTIAQDEETSVIFGMNKEAIDKGCIDCIVSLDKISETIYNIIS